MPDDGGETTANEARSGDASRSDATPRHEATILVRGEALAEPSAVASDPSADKDRKPPAKPKSPPKEVSAAKLELQNRLPALDDDADIGVDKHHIVTRDGKADLAFTGTLLASAAPAAAPQGYWQELRVYRTNGGKHVFSKIHRTLFVEESDECEADVFDPAPSSMPSQLLRSARDLTRSRPMTWMDAAVAFFLATSPSPRLSTENSTVVSRNRSVDRVGGRCDLPTQHLA
jgi:hypothetical protein